MEHAGAAREIECASELFDALDGKPHELDVLELVALRHRSCVRERLFGDVLIKKHAMFDAVLGEGALVRDDWK